MTTMIPAGVEAARTLVGPEVTGKPVHSDLRARKKSLPVVAALTSQTPAARKLAPLLRSPDALSEDELAFAAVLIEEAGGKSWTEAEAATQLDTARTCLAETPMPDEVRTEFAAIAEFITTRQW